MKGTVALFVVAVCCICTIVSADDNGVARTPPMGWNSWNHFACNIDQQKVLSMAQAMKANGMLAAGYEYINLDDCWQIARDNTTGEIIADPKAFPSGIAWLADQLHQMGFKAGLYTCAGNFTCQGRPGSRGYECIDANTYASWKIDYVKEDWCHTRGMNPVDAYTTMHKCLNKTGRAITFSLCDWGVGDPAVWGSSVGNLWRTTQDIKDVWQSMMWNYDHNKKLHKFAGPGGWNDPDMLEVGNGGMSLVEYRSHFSLWSVMASPLIAGNDLTNMTSDIASILMAKEVIAVNQDPLGVQGAVISGNSSVGWEVLSKQLGSLSSNDFAVVLFNRHKTHQTVVVHWSDIDVKYTNKPAKVRDLWQRKNIGTFIGTFSASLEGHAVSMIKVSF